MTYYVVVTRDKSQHVIERYATIEAAANKIIRERKFHQWGLLAQNGGKSAPMRELTKAEQRRLEAKLFPELFND